MGHDIYAFRNKAHRDTGPLGPPPNYGAIAYLRRTAFDDLNDTLYRALNAGKHYCGVSGCGTEQYFTREELTAAYKSLGDNPNYEREREFLTECLIYPGDGVLIHFG